MLFFAPLFSLRLCVRFLFCKPIEDYNTAAIISKLTGMVGQ